MSASSRIGSPFWTNCPAQMGMLRTRPGKGAQDRAAIQLELRQRLTRLGRLELCLADVRGGCARIRLGQRLLLLDFGLRDLKPGIRLVAIELRQLLRFPDRGTEAGLNGPYEPVGRGDDRQPSDRLQDRHDLVGIGRSQVERDGLDSGTGRRGLSPRDGPADQPEESHR